MERRKAAIGCSHVIDGGSWDGFGIFGIIPEQRAARKEILPYVWCLWGIAPGLGKTG